jgi:hypothetical protein
MVPADAVETNYAPIPEGHHNIKISNAEEDMSKAGSEMIKITCDVEGHPGKLFERLIFQPNCVWKLLQVMDAVGLDTPGEGEQLALGTDDLIGKRATVNVGHEEYNGKTQARITEWWTLKEDAAKPAASGAAQF